MNFSVRFIFSLFCILIAGGSFSAYAQVDSVIGQFTSTNLDSLVRDVSGDGRFVVIESTADLSTVPGNKNNADGNREIFLFDYAQRHIFQITNTKSLLVDTTMSTTSFSNIKVVILNTRPVISNDGRWIAFGSNATTATPATPTNTTNPGNFDANSFTDSTGNNVLTADGNTEMWLYQIPQVPAANLSSGIEPAFVNLAAGTFTRVTNTTASQTPFPGTTLLEPIIADDNRDASISDNGSVVAFTSNRDVVPSSVEASSGNAVPDDNPEIYVYNRTSNAFSQITKTISGSITNRISNSNSVISGNGLRVAFASNANAPIRGTTGGNNSDRNREVFVLDLNANGSPNLSGVNRQITQTTNSIASDVINIFSQGKRMSRDGNYIAFESRAQLDQASGTNQANYATFLYNVSAASNQFIQIGPRNDADSGANGGDVLRFPTFTDYTGTVPSTLILTTRLNIKADGTVPGTASDGLNPDASRPPQVYSFPLATTPTPTFTRLTKIPAATFSIPSLQPLPSNAKNRIVFNLSSIETGTGNFDLNEEGYYLLVPNVTFSDTGNQFSFATGASAYPVGSPLPTPSPTATPTPTSTPTPTPTPTPTGTPTPTPTATPTPTPVTPSAQKGLSPDMLAVVNFTAGVSRPIVTRAATGVSTTRQFNAPIELSGVSMTISGAACRLLRVDRRQIYFVTPAGLSVSDAQPVVINNNGVILRGTIDIVPTRPDAVTKLSVIGPGGRARVQNVTNRVATNEPFTVTTFRFRPGGRVATVLRVYVTGISGATTSNTSFSVRIRDQTITTLVTQPTLSDFPGIYYFDIALPSALDGAGDVPIVITVNSVSSRLDDTAPKFRIL